MSESDATPDPALTGLEDAELRQLTWFGLAGDLSEKSQARIAELRSRDRRGEVRDPRPDPISHDSTWQGIEWTDQSQRDSESDAEEFISCPNCSFGPLPEGGVVKCPQCGVQNSPRWVSARPL
ncbi:MAG TPA: hypothetical protein VFV02_17820 [Acidimicrobiales bacterium]|nr:hypothetical protein [Acidimicrobiales bacterium]